MNSENLINCWSMNLGKFKEPVLPYAITVVAPWPLSQQVTGSSPLTVMTNISVTAVHCIACTHTFFTFTHAPPVTVHSIVRCVFRLDMQDLDRQTSGILLQIQNKHLDRTSRSTSLTWRRQCGLTSRNPRTAPLNPKQTLRKESPLH